MRRVLLLVALLGMGLSAQDAGEPYWGVQIGAVRGDFSPSLKGANGPTLGVHYTYPFSPRQEIRFAVDALSINGKTETWDLYGGGGWGPILDSGPYQIRANAQTIRLDYRLHFFRGGTGPYVAPGLLIGRYEETTRFNGPLHPFYDHNSGVDWATSVALGMQFRHSFALELGTRTFNNQEMLKHFTLTASYHF
ncbi:MAG: outer membrane beta-barrel protein [Firmicutes bacterium]|nr:outer membrane beta-barrel protein [Bacillota bacterium]